MVRQIYPIIFPQINTATYITYSLLNNSQTPNLTSKHKEIASRGYSHQKKKMNSQEDVDMESKDPTIPNGVKRPKNTNLNNSPSSKPSNTKKFHQDLYANNERNNSQEHN